MLAGAVNVNDGREIIWREPRRSGCHPLATFAAAAVRLS